MKRMILITGMAVACLLYACSKSTPPPNNGQPDNNGNSGNTGNGGTGNTGNTGNGGTQATLTITDFSPKSAQPASNITITGTGFGNDASAVQVAIGNSPYDHPVSVTPTSLVTKTNLATPSGKISVIVNGVKVFSAGDFTALPEDLKILSVSGAAGETSSAQLGRQMYINGQGFGTDSSNIKVSFAGGLPVKPNVIGREIVPIGFIGAISYIGAIVPRNAQEGKVTLTIGDRTATSDQTLKFEMSLRDFSPKTFSSGDTVKVTGVAFTSASDMSVDFNSPTGSITRAITVTPTELLVIVPSNAQPGYLRVSAKIGTITDFIFDDEHKYKIIPTVSFNNNFTPGSGKIGETIRINGDFVGADIKTLGVSFGGSKAVHPASITGPDIYVKIPSDAKTGKITISRTGYKSFTGSFTFTILP